MNDRSECNWTAMQTAAAELRGAQRIMSTPQQQRQSVIDELKRAYDEAVERFREELDGDIALDLCAYGDTRGCGGGQLFEPRALDHDGVCPQCRALEEADADEAAHGYVRSTDVTEGRGP